jgi:serine/threonine protein kinase
MTSLVHPNILRIEGVFVKPLAIAVELIRGSDLGSCIGDPSWQQRTNPSVRHQLLLDIASALQHMHSKRFIHRDVKSHNILIHEYSTGLFVAKICDFGTAVQLQLPILLSPKERARILSSRFPPTQAKNTSRTSDGGSLYSSPRFVVEERDREDEVIDINEDLGVVGTLGYTAPEILEQQPYSYPVDVFSFAIAAWELFAEDICVNPLKNPDNLLDRIHLGERPPWQDSHPHQMREVISSCWMSLPTLRPSMAEVARNLLASPETIPSRQKEDIPQFRFKVRY